jgi:hypothetical protein
MKTIKENSPKIIQLYKNYKYSYIKNYKKGN